MMRSLWTSASGMKTQQMYVDSIANNLANVNTAGFKKGTMEFKDLFYETLIESGVDEKGYGSPVSLQVGHGVRAAASVKDFTQGSIERTENPLDFSIEGDGFFVLEGLNGEKHYSRQGGFKLSILDDELRLVASDGFPVLTTEDEPITFEGTFLAQKLSVDPQGNLSYINENKEIVDLGMQIGIVQFKNPAGLDAIGGTYYKSTSASGEAIYEADNDELKKSSINQGTIEASNVKVVEEMVKMIVAQRAYELNSQGIKTADEMLGMANNLKR